MSRGATIFAFVLGFVFAFGGTAIFTYLGQNPAWVWAIFACVGFWLWQLPTLKNLDLRMTMLCAYAFPFLALWFASGKVLTGDIKTFVFEMVLGAIILAGLVSIAFMFSLGRKKPELKASVHSLALLFFFAWLVAFFSASTGAGRHMIDFAMHVLGMSKDGAETAVGVARKCTHFVFYGSMGAVAFRAARKAGASQVLLMALIFVLLHSSFDEIRQSSYADRTGSFWDVCLDMAGACCFAFVAYAVSKKRRPVAEANA